MWWVHVSNNLSRGQQPQPFTGTWVKQSQDPSEVKKNTPCTPGGGMDHSEFII